MIVSFIFLKYEKKDIFSIIVKDKKFKLIEFYYKKKKNIKRKRRSVNSDSQSQIQFSDNQNIY